MGREVPALAAQVVGRQVLDMFAFSRNAQGGGAAGADSKPHLGTDHLALWQPQG